jgi:hypothetical protein
MTAELARRLAELRACENVRELHVVTLDHCGYRALVLLVPQSEDSSSGGGWAQPSEPFLMLIDSAELPARYPLH